MIKKLRTKLVAVSMLSLFLVLAVIMGAVNVLNYQKICTDADSILAILQENGGKFPKKDSTRKQENPHGQKPMSAEIPYESRYFCVYLAQDGQLLSLDTGKIAAIDDATAVQYARQIFRSGTTQGFLGDYRYSLRDTGGKLQMIFLDCGRSLSNFHTFLAASGIISLLGLLAVFLLILLLSNRIMRPVLESYEKQKQFITDAGHELKTPITIIDADMEVLEMEVGENEWLRDIRAQTRRLASLTGDLIFLSRMEEDQVPLQRLPLPFTDLVAETAQSFRALAITQNKTFQEALQPMVSLEGDDKTLRQLTSILLDNALKYSPEQGAITIRLERQKRTVLLTVENTTCQSLPAQLGFFFDRFYRADSSRNSQAGGYGLGLSIAKAIVEAHGGRISAKATSDTTLQLQAVFPVSSL